MKPEFVTFYSKPSMSEAIGGALVALALGSAIAAGQVRETKAAEPNQMSTSHEKMHASTIGALPPTLGAYGARLSATAILFGLEAVIDRAELRLEERRPPHGILIASPTGVKIMTKDTPAKGGPTSMAGEQTPSYTTVSGLRRPA